MLNENIQPSSLDGIKRLANQIKKTKGLSHHEALNVAAQAASYANFTHARRQLQNGSKTQAKQNQLFFTVYWYDKDNNHEEGRETLEINISKPLTNIATTSEMKSARDLGWFRHTTLDHLVCDDVAYSQEEARRSICKAVRTLRFIEATGLKPSKNYDSAYPKRDHNNKLPKCDHSTDWHDPQTGQFVLIDEPYRNAMVDDVRAVWAKKHNWHVQASTWPGMYYPYDCSLFVATDASTNFDFHGLMSKLDAMPEPITVDNWNGVSSVGHDTFFSPLAISPQDKKRSKAKGTIWRLSSTRTVPMWSKTSLNERRPNAVMPITTHLIVARQIKAVLHSSHKPLNVNTKLSSIRSTLENWFFKEHSREETDKHELFYYGDIENEDPYVAEALTTKGNIDLLKDIKRALEKSYIDCLPLRKLMKKLETSIRITRDFDTK